MSRRTATEWAFFAAGLLLLGTALLVWRWREHATAGQEQRTRLETQARILEDHLGLLMLSVDRALTITQSLVDGGPGLETAAAVSERLAQLTDTAVAIRTLQILDADGHVLASSSSHGDGAAATQPCFERARTNPDPGLIYVCTPYLTPRGRWSVHLLRARFTTDHRFDGAVDALLDADVLNTALPSPQHAADMRAFLTDARGVVIASGEADAKTIGADLTQGGGKLLKRYIATGQPNALIEGTSAVSGSVRMVAFRALRSQSLRFDEPPLLSVGLGLATAYQGWMLTTGLCAALWLLAAGGGTALLYRLQSRRRMRADQATLLRRQRLAELERIELIVGGADLSLWVWHVAEGRWEVDPRWCAMVGCPADDLERAGASWAGRVHPDDVAMVRRERERLAPAQANHVAQFEYRLRHDDGRWIWVMVRGKVVERDADGVPRRYAGTLLDVTDRKQIEQELRRSEESLATTLQSIGDAVIATDVHGRVVRLNPTAERLTGWRADEAVGQPLGAVFRILDGRTREPVPDPVQAVLARGEIDGPANGTLLVDRNGSERQIADSAAPIRGASGEVTGVVLVFSDVTEAYRVQQALRDSEEQLRLITDAMPSLVGRYDLQRRFVFANAPHERYTGVPPRALIGRTLAEVFGVDVMEPLLPYTLRAEGGEEVTFETTVVNPMLGKTHLLVTLVPDHDTHGVLRGHFSVSTDITRLRNAEAERRGLEGQLREAQKMESIGTLAGGIAHDFNNVLGAVIGNAELALLELDAGRAPRRHLQQISRVGRRSRGLVQQILTFSRRQPQQRAEQPLLPLIEETIAMLRSTLPARVELATDIDAPPLVVNVDATQIQQVLMNLGTNAWHALGGAGRITVGLRSVAPAEQAGAALRPGPPGLPAPLRVRHAHLWVRDDGSGMDAATRERIFEPFFTTKPVGQGTGLGLSVVHGIVKAHLGTISVDTAPGRGSTFHVFLPAAERVSQTSAPHEAEPRVPRGTGQHVMVVDDDEVMVTVVEQALLSAGYRVSALADAKQALAAFIERPRAFDLVVTDFNMPDFSGLELAGELARIRPDLPVVISSGFLSEELHAGARRIGVRHLVQKQNTFEELAAVVGKVLAGEARGRG